jgi:2-methylcitrate dehydratase PrpD
MKKLGSIIIFMLLSSSLFADETLDQTKEIGLTQKVAQAVIAFSHEDIPPDVIEYTRYLIADSIAVAVGAHHTQVYKDVEAMLGINGGKSLLLASGRKASLLEATYLNSFAANVLDFDDSHVETGHPGATIIPPALLLAEKYKKSDEELVEAIVAGYEFNIRWGRSAFNYPGKFSGPWSSAALQVFGTTVMAAKLLDLSEDEIRIAMYLAAANTPLPVYQKVGLLPGQVMSGLKNNYGHTARAGVEAVLLAKAGITAEPTVLDGDQGLWRMLGAREFHPEHILAGIGSVWEIMGMQIKPYGACRWMHSSIDAFRHLSTEIPADKIKAVDVHIYDFAVTALSKAKPSTVLELQFSMPHIFGLISEGHRLVDLRLSDAANERALEFSSRVDLHLNQHYDEQYKVHGQLPAKVVLTTMDGAIFEKEVLLPLGEKDNPLSKQQHLEKITQLIDASPYRNVRKYARRFVPDSDR